MLEISVFPRQLWHSATAANNCGMKTLERKAKESGQLVDILTSTNSGKSWWVGIFTTVLPGSEVDVGHAS